MKVGSTTDRKKIILQFQIIERIGKGTFGTVFKVNTRDGREFALKEVRHNKRFKSREVIILKQLNHKNIIKLHYHCTEKLCSETCETIFMDLMPESLSSFIGWHKNSDSTIPPVLISSFTYQLLRGLAHIHYREIAHRDIKPLNLLVDIASGHVKICDFGSAKRLNDKTRNASYICSRGYRAPELLFNNHDYTVAIDIWSAGCCMGEMIQLAPLLRGTDTKDQILRIFRTLGRPTEDEIQCLRIQPKLLSPENFSPRDNPTKEFISKSPELTVRFLFDLLQYNPALRPSAWEALKDEYFDELCRYDCTIPDALVVPKLFDWTKEELNYDQLLDKADDRQITVKADDKDSDELSSCPSPSQRYDLPLVIGEESES